MNFGVIYESKKLQKFVQKVCKFINILYNIILYRTILQLKATPMTFPKIRNTESVKNVIPGIRNTDSVKTGFQASLKIDQKVKGTPFAQISNQAPH